MKNMDLIDKLKNYSNECDNHTNFSNALVDAVQKESRYWNDFIELNFDFKNNLSKREYNRFAHKFYYFEKMSIMQYIQYASEATIIDYLIRNYNNNFKYEPCYNDKKTRNVHSSIREELLMSK